MTERGILFLLGALFISHSLMAMENIEKMALECLCSPAEEIQEQLNKLLEAIDEFQLTSGDEELNKQLADLKTEALSIQQSQQLGSMNSFSTRAIITPESLKTAKMIVDTIQLAAALMQSMPSSSGKSNDSVDGNFKTNKNSVTAVLEIIKEIESKLEECIHPKDPKILNTNISGLADKLHILKKKHKIKLPDTIKDFLKAIKNGHKDAIEKAEAAKFVFDTIKFLVHTKKVASEIIDSLDTNPETHERCKPMLSIYKSYCGPYTSAALCLAIAVVLTTVFNT